jgi:hypothetical protein
VGVRVNNNPLEPELYIHGEGKTVSFDGVVFFECDTDLDPIWKTASVWDAEPADLVMIAETVPAERDGQRPDGLLSAVIQGRNRTPYFSAYIFCSLKQFS